MAKKRAGAEPAEAAQNSADLGPQEPEKELLDRPRKRLTPAQFFRAIAEYPDQEATCTYIYRRWPVIDRKLTGGEDALTYIDKLAGPVSDDYLRRNWGNGEYRIRFCDENRPRGQTEVCTTVVTINEDGLEPVLDLAELVVGHPANRSFVQGLRLRGLLPKEDDVPQNQNPDPATAQLAGIAGEVIRQGLGRKPDVGEALQSKVLDLFSQASQKAVELAAAQKADPLELLLKARELFRSDPEASVLRVLLESQAKDRELLLELMKAQTHQKPAQSLEGELATVERLANLLDRFGRRSGGSDLTAVLQVLPEVLKPVATMVNAWAAARLGPGAAPPTQPITPPARVESFPAPAEAPMSMPIPDSVLQVLGQQLLEALGRGVSGDQFADSLVTFYGEGVYDQIAALGRDGILRALQSVPTLWARLEPVRPQLERFVGEFLAYGEGEDDRPPDPGAGLPRAA